MTNESTGTRITLLVVDDNADLAMAVHMSFEEHPTIESIGWIDASDLIVETVLAQRPDVMLLDLTMPGVDPLEALRELRARGAPLKVIAFSGYDDAETVRLARAAGADAFLGKSADPDRIAKAVADVCGRK
ncbi:MAG: response regulator transcription factor [Phycisphaerales bacterium]